MSGTEAEDSRGTESSTVGTPHAAERSATVEVLPTDEFSQYMLKSRSEMFAVFRGMVEHVSQITMFFNEGRDMMLTSLVSYGDNGLVFDLGANPETNNKALAAKKLFCVTQLDKVKIQFILRGLRTIEVSGGPAFLAALPDGVLRLQRREFYRLATPIANPLKCVITFPPATGGNRRVLEAPICDISGGGIGVISIPLDIPLETGMTLGCRIELPEVGTVSSTVAVRSVFETVGRNGIRSKRAGCEFVKLPGSMLTLIQRYIIKVERDRKARESGRG